MLSFITDNLGTIIVCAVVLSAVTGIIIYMVRQKKKGKTSCGCNCAGCALKGSCHKQTETDK